MSLAECGARVRDCAGGQLVGDPVPCYATREMRDRKGG